MQNLKSQNSILLEPTSFFHNYNTNLFLKFSKCTYWYETGQQLTLKDAKNQTTTWSYNLRGQLLTKVYPNGDDHAYTYDALGRMATHTTPKNEVCTYSYDLRDRQTLASWNTTTPATVRDYFANGLPKSIDNGVSRSDYAYSVRNELTSETQTLGSAGFQPASFTVSHTYDADGLRLQMNSPSGSPVDYEWTAKGQLHVISRDGPPPLATYTYDKAGRNTALAHENGITQERQYDAASQLLSNLHRKAGLTVSGHTYTHDTTGRRTGETFANGLTPARTYGYDAADQVASVEYGGGLTDSYAYDAAANRTTATVAALGGTATTYTANNVNQYTSIGGAVTRLPQHDANGNLTNDGAGNTYTWDSENRLLSISGLNSAGLPSVVSYTYDGQHRRVTKRTAVSGTVTEKTHYVYDGWNVIEERHNTDTTPGFDLTTFKLRKTLTWGTDLSGTLQGAGGVGDLLLVEELRGVTTTAHHFHFDGNGNVTEITDHLGLPTATYRYDAFGNTLVATGSYAAQNNYRFSTKPLDNEIANAPLYYYGYRFYDPGTGRWPSRDPIGEDGGLNLYGMAFNDPIDFFDVLGRNVKVFFDCTLISGGLPGRAKPSSLFRNCDYSCTETSREQLNFGGPPLLDDLPAAPIKITTSSQQFCGCKSSIKTVRIFAADSLKIDCSRKDCRSGCDLAAAAGLKSKNPVLRAAALAARTVCYDTCDTICNNP